MTTSVMETYMNYYLDAFRRYADFEGRANRPQFWYFVLISMIVSLLVGAILGRSLQSLYSLAVFVPSIAIGARRLHDIGKSGWMQLVALIPLVGIVWLIVLFAQPSTAQAQQSDAQKSAPKEDTKEETAPLEQSPSEK